ncbi:pisatin demethylase [Delitschia confertaspora ATCC 74209]|uniref:Pisatin demethylase n=1 Tax=Delitschia confertaspora ATCC 74209 TaxID=1513339 RepID=A0A9P4JXP9_9PLEO|nr:pisatin demethylase [Delitschia confertaspora ATCC 74209]
MANVLVHLPIVAFIALFIWLLRSYLRLRHIPGPFLASITNLPRVQWVRSNKAHDIHVALHRKYGKIVRFGPDMVSVQDPREIAKIYNYAGTFPKSDFYRVLLFFARGKPVPTIFATQDDNLHRTLRKPIAPIYSMSNMMSFERYVDSTISVFFNQLETRYIKTGAVCDLGTWLQWFAFDFMGEITFSKRLGFLEGAEDVGGITENIWKYFQKTSPISQIPWVDRLWTKNPIFQSLKSVSANPVVAFGIERAKERQMQGKEGAAEHAGDLNEKDFLSRFLAAIKKDPSIPPFALTAWTTSNVTAGSDTTAILLRTIFHSLLTHPDSMQRLMEELDTASSESRLCQPAKWNEARNLPYLDAVIKEAGRLHPPFGLPLERVVPAPGATICGEFLPAGTVVGMSGWVVHRDMDTFGLDCDDWRPERWIECSEEERRSMEHALLTFGAGNRTCLGKNISYLEIYKLVPSMLKAFDFQLADPTDSSWKIMNRWFVNQEGLKVIIRPRKVVV